MTEPLYRIGEAARLLELETYVLRFWETEFAQLEPLRTPKGQRLYTATHLDLLRRVKSLLYEDGLTIDGARKVLARESGAEETPDKAVAPKTLTVMRPAKPARFVQGTLIPRPTPIAKDSVSRKFLQELRAELCILQTLLHETGASAPPTPPPSDTSKDTSA